MRIKSIHLLRVGPVAERTFEFKNEWAGGIHEKALISGPNGSGKSMILRAVAHLWKLAGMWLSMPARRARDTFPSRKWLARWGAVAVVLEDMPAVGQAGLFWGEPAFLDQLKLRLPAVTWLGETRKEPAGRGRPAQVLLHKDQPWVEALAAGYRRLVLNGGGDMPNLIHLDSEERRWVTPTTGLGEVVADDPQLRWLVNYRPNWEWKGQLEASLIALKTVDAAGYRRVLKDLNDFLTGKEILADPDPVSLRLIVRTETGGRHGAHSLDDLSAGEHQVMIQLYLVSRWLQPGGVVMIDEPDLHLHPSLLEVFLARLESLVTERRGQLLLTSHNPELWRRYENKGLRIQLQGNA